MDGGGRQGKAPWYGTVPAPPESPLPLYRLTLLVPELFPPERPTRPPIPPWPCPAWNGCWPAASPAVPRAARPAETALAAGFGLDEAAPRPPCACLANRLRPTAPTPGRCHWLCADPVHLRFHHERIVLADAGAFDLRLRRRSPRPGHRRPQPGIRRHRRVPRRHRPPLVPAPRAAPRRWLPPVGGGRPQPGPRRRRPGFGSCRNG